jgi:putative ABC transport system permease protein
LLRNALRFVSTMVEIALAALWRLVKAAINRATPLILKLAIRNLLHDRLRFAATIIGIVFSMTLVTMQMGLFISFERMVTTLIDHAPADLWIVAHGTKCFEQPVPLEEAQRLRALSVKGVTDATPVAIGFAQWRMRDSDETPVYIVGTDLDGPGLRPWNLIAGNVRALSIPGAVAIDRSYFKRLESKGLGDIAEISNERVQVQAVTSGIRSFTTSPYVFAPLDRARAYIGLSPNEATYFLVNVSAGADIEAVRRRLQQTLSQVEVLTPDEFRSRSRTFWLLETGAGAALFAGALLGFIVGTVIVAQTLYASTKDHLPEFATLRAIGCSGAYIRAVIIIQALVSAIIGFGIAASLGAIIARATVESALPVIIPPPLTLGLLILTVAMCVLSAISAIVKVTRMDPAMVFTR